MSFAARLRLAILLACSTLACPLPAAAEPPPPTAALPAAPHACAGTARLREGMVEWFRAHPRRTWPRPIRASVDGGTAPRPVGGPGFVTIVDEDNSIFTTNWDSPEQSGTTMMAIQSAYYSIMPDDVQFIVVYTGWPLPLGAFYLPLANDVKGIGYKHQGHREEIFDYTGESPLEGMLLMNSVDFWGDGAFGAAVFDQELGHRWGSFVYFEYGGDVKKNNRLLGRDLQHWSYYLDTAFSPLEGNRWKNNGDGSFTIDGKLGHTPLFSPLDLYLMGFIPPADVPPMVLIDVDAADQQLTMPDGRGGKVTRSTPPEYGGREVTVKGAAREVTLDDILAVEGAREPDHTKSPRSFTIGFVLVTRPGQQYKRNVLDRMKSRVAVASEAFVDGTGGRAMLQNLTDGEYPKQQPRGGECPFGYAQCDPAESDACVTPPDPPEGLTPGEPEPENVCAPLCRTGCASGCCMAGRDGRSYCFADRFCPPPAPDMASAPGGGTGCEAAGAGRARGAAADSGLAAVAVALAFSFLRRRKKGAKK